MPLPAGYRNARAVRTRKNRKRNMSAIYKQTWTNAAALDPNGISVSHAGAAVAGTTLQTIGGALAASLGPYARNFIITVTHASSIVAMNVIVTGEDMFGNVITETWAVTATGTSKLSTGLKAFAVVTSITEVIAADASTNTIISGTGDVLGLELPASSITPVAEEEDGAAPTAGVVVAASSVATADRYGTYEPNSALDAAIDLDLWYIVDVPEMAAD